MTTASGVTRKVEEASLITYCVVAIHLALASAAVELRASMEGAKEPLDADRTKEFGTRFMYDVGAMMLGK